MLLKLYSGRSKISANIESKWGIDLNRVARVKQHGTKPFNHVTSYCKIKQKNQSLRIEKFQFLRKKQFSKIR